MITLPTLGKEVADPEKLASKASKYGKVLKYVLEGISSEEAKIRFGCSKVLRMMSEDDPKKLYPHWDFFEDMLDNENTFLRANAVHIVANLTKVDSNNKFEKLFDKFYKLIDDKSMITAANLFRVSGAIARAKPKLQTKITDRLLSVDKTRHSRECKNIIKGDAILTFDEYFEKSKDKKKILDFMRKEVKNSRAATRKKAEKFLEKWDK